MNKIEILTQALSTRNDEILSYQINIDNYRLAIEHIDELKDPDLDQFREQLHNLLKSEILEQKKTNVIRTVIEKQLKG